jgi:O-acetyl-ADP-ribose deacetylase (regulator of RNase III)
MDVDAIVSATNTSLLLDAGVSKDISEAAGRELQEAASRLAPIEIGEAVITPGFALPARWVILTAAPRNRGKDKDVERLRLSYRNSLELAQKQGLESIAMPLLSTEILGYPKKKAFSVATQVIRSFLNEYEMDIWLIVDDKESFSLSKKLLGDVESYLDDHLEGLQTTRHRDFSARSSMMQEGRVESIPSHSIEDVIGKLDEPFSVTLFRLIDAKNLNDVEVYKKANLDRKLFSKIRSVENYRPGKRTVLALAIALELNLKETEDLLMRAGFALSRSQKFDVIVEYFIVNGNYDLFTINEVLFQYDQPLLGSGG